MDDAPPSNGLTVCNDLSKIFSKSYGQDLIICTKEKTTGLYEKCQSQPKNIRWLFMLRKNVMDLTHLLDPVANLGHVKLCFEVDISHI